MVLESFASQENGLSPRLETAAVETIDTRRSLAGTGFVHIAPNHGEEDFSVGQKYGLGNIRTVNSKGMYEDNINFG